MALARWTAALIDEQGNSLDGTEVEVEVRLEIPGQPLTPVPYADDAGTSPLGNSFKTSNGEIAFHVVGARYQIRAFTGPSGDPTFEKIWRYVPIGLAAGTDILGLTPQGDWSSIVTYEIGHLVNHGGLSFASNIATNLNNTPPATAVSDANWTYIPAIKGDPGSSDVVGTSTTSLTPALGSNALTIVEPSRGWGAGARVRVSSDADPVNDWFEGPIGSYADPALNVTADKISETISGGAKADWTVNLAGEIGAPATDYKAVSATSLGITTGSKAFTIPAGKQFQAGQFGQATSDADPTVDFMHFVVDSYVSTTLNVTVGHVGGSGTHTDWSINISGPAITGATGPAGPVGTVQDFAHVVDTANLDPASGAYANGQTVGGRAVVTGETILRAGTTSQEDNGMWLVPASGAASRHTDYDTWDEHLGKLIAILLGDGDDDIYQIAADPGGTLDTTAIAVSQQSGAASETVEGLVERLTGAEVTTGTDTTRYASIAQLVATFQKINSGKSVPEVLGSPAGASTITPEPSAGAAKTLTRNAAFSWQAPTEEGGYVCIVTNGASAATTTPLGFDEEETENFDEVNGNKFEVCVTNIGGQQSMTVRALQ